MRTEPRDNVRFFKSLFESGENSEVLQQKITDFFPAINYVSDSDQKKFRFVNKKFTYTPGYSCEDIEHCDNDFMKFVFENDVSLVQNEIEKHSLKDNDTHSNNSRFIHKLGNLRYFRTQDTILQGHENAKPCLFTFCSPGICIIGKTII